MRNHAKSGIALLTTMLVLVLISAMLVGFIILVMTDQKLGGVNSDRTRAFYAAEAGMEKMTADLGTLFDTTYSPSAAQLNAIVQNPPPLPGISYVSPRGGSGYQLDFPRDAQGNPKAQTATISSGPYQGLLAMSTPYTLTVTAHTMNGSEVKLVRTTQTVGIPAFQFGIYSQTDLSFFAGPDFNFGGRVHTNGNLFLAEGTNSTLTLQDRVTAVDEVIRTNLSNGWLTSNNYAGRVNVTTSPGNNSYRALGTDEGSLVGPLKSRKNEPLWTNLSLGTNYYAGNLRNGRTGARPLNLDIVALGRGTTFPVDLLRRPKQAEDATNPAVLGTRYFAEASLKILISDNPVDIMNLPCVNTAVPPVDLSTLAVDQNDPIRGPSFPPAWYTGSIRVATSNAQAANYSAGDGYWIPKFRPTITGWIKIELQNPYGAPCGGWTDVTREILNLGFTGRSTYVPPGPPPAPQLPGLPAAGSYQPPSTCADPSPNAVIRLQRVRDNPVTGPPCGLGATNSTEFWPNVLFDPREGNLRDSCPGGNCNSQQIALGGVMHYVELDVNNLARWFTGQIGVQGPLAKDQNAAPNDFVVYFSDRRGNYTPAPAPVWPPASPSGNETGEYGFFDHVNPTDASGCPNGALDEGEDLDLLGGAAPVTYGMNPTPNVFNNLLAGVVGGAIQQNPNCLAPATPWPGWVVTNTQEARQNPALFFRRALKVVNGSSINLGLCPNNVNCGLTIASENPVYVQGNYNSIGTFNPPTPHVAAAVITDAFTFLSNNWNDVNSFISPYNTGGRPGATTWYRLGIVAGKGISFQRPTTYPVPQDFGTDGGAHNFLRYIENWGGQMLNYRGSMVSMFHNRQAIGIYKCCNTVYSPPSRAYAFDTEFLQPSLLPPRTPMFRDVNTTGFTQLIRPNQ